MQVLVKKLDELSVQDFYQITEERIKVFVVEQNCPYQEIDTQDVKAYHLMLRDNQNNLVGYTRIIDKNSTQATFGRVLVPKRFRKNKYGRMLVQATIEKTQEIFPNKKITIQAQAYLEEFYKSFGFQPTSEIYLEDDIPHLDMIL
ncbi:GNAT family N-acetyltransferase [Pediococcus pentosaceus]|uniref:GNAT family N-acetyltransferase n=1 Tax=Pediococcus pentosaceus TaxID=1255 RepID=UPI0021A43A4E|nr:GNAT family N-acetyltransferase [Pediococcus pentosaceus]MCT3019917.1 GNAT family N-acetyltransferase [Pediococcus pentosaceus]